MKACARTKSAYFSQRALPSFATAESLSLHWPIQNLKSKPGSGFMVVVNLRFCCKSTNLLYISTNLQQVLGVCICLEIKFVKYTTTMNPNPGVKKNVGIYTSWFRVKKENQNFELKGNASNYELSSTGSADQSRKRCAFKTHRSQSVGSWWLSKVQIN